MINETTLNELLALIFEKGEELYVDKPPVVIGQADRDRYAHLQTLNHREKLQALTPSLELSVIDGINRLLDIVEGGTAQSCSDASLCDFCSHLNYLNPVYLTFFLQKANRAKVCALIGEKFSRLELSAGVLERLPEDMKATVNAYVTGGWKSKFSFKYRVFQVAKLIDALEQNIRLSDPNAVVDRKRLRQIAEKFDNAAI